MKKVFLILICLLLALSVCLLVAACDETPATPSGNNTSSDDGGTQTSPNNNTSSDDGHTHTYSSAWTKDDTYHWHDATCGHDVTSGKANHTWQVTSTQPATESAAGTQYYTCSVCGATKTESIPQLSHTHTYSGAWNKDDTYHWHAATCGHDVTKDKKAHTWNDGVVTKESTVTTEGIKTYTCTVCGATKTESIPQLSHTHTYSGAWNKDDTYHWHDATCGHDVTKDKKAHTWNDGVVTKESTVTTEGIKTYTCTVCGATKTVSIPTISDEGNESDDPNNFTFVSYQSGYAITSYCGTNSVVTVPSTYNGKSVLAIGIYTDNDLSLFSRPSSYDLTQNAGFYQNKTITKVILPDTIIAIGAMSFCDCSNLQEVNIPTSCTIHALAFSNTALKSITIPANVTVSTWMPVFSGVALESIRFEGAIDFVGRTILAAYVSSQASQSFELTQSDIQEYFIVEDNVDMAYGGDIRYSFNTKKRWFWKNNTQYYLRGNPSITTNDTSTRVYFDGRYVTIKEYKPTKISGYFYTLPKSLKTIYVSAKSENVEAMVGNATQLTVEYYDGATITSQITCDYNGGTGLNASTYSFAESYTLVAPTRKGYTFTGWTGSNGDTPQLTVTIPRYTKGNKTYKANWQLTQYTIAYNLQGGSASNPTSYTINTSAFTLVNPTRTGYTFTGWTSANSSTPQISVCVDTQSCADLIYTANWQLKQYTVTYNLNGGTATNPTTYTTDMASFTLANPTKTGYTFTGWTGSNGNTPQTSVTVNTQVACDLTYTANWQAIQYTITYVLNGGSNDSRNPTTYTYGTDSITLHDPSYTGLTFLGWQIEDKTVTSIDRKLQKDLTITAKWDMQITNKVLVKYNGSDETVTIPAGVTSIGSKAFENCSGMTSVAIPAGVTSIGAEAFYGCSGLTSITIPSSVTFIGGYAFEGCLKLLEVYNKSTLNITSGSNDYGRVGYYAIAIYTQPYTSKLSTDDQGWVRFTDGDNVILTGYVGTETMLTIPEDITIIHKYAFYNCTELTSITIPNSVVSIGESAFSCCRGLSSITIPEGVTHIGIYAFYGCSGLTAIIIPSSVTVINFEAFYGCSGLTSIYYTGDIAGWCAISGLNRLMQYGASGKSLYIGGTKIEGDLVIPGSVTSIGAGAFYGCSGLISITIPAGVTYIGTYAFYGCSGLISINYQGTKTQWSAIRKGSSWNGFTGKYTVYCTDGNIAK